MNTTSESQKLCTQCGSWRGLQSLDCFDKDSRSKDGHRSLCKACRRERRYARPAPNNGKAPNLHQGAKRIAKKSPPNARVKLAAAGHGVCLVLLFVGGFGWSTLNGSFAFLDTAHIISAKAPGMVAVVAAGVLTLGTAISASWAARLWHSRSMAAATVLLGVFVALQSLNLVVNLSGVKKRLLLSHQQQAQQTHLLHIAKLQLMKDDYHRIIERYPPVNKHGNPVVWKREITVTVKAAYDEIRRLNREIMTLEDSMVNTRPEFAWHLLLAWLVLPELCMLTVILVFSFGWTGKFEPQDMA